MFKIENWGSDTSNIKNSLGGPAYFRYYNQENNDITTAGYFPDNLRLKEGDRIVVIPQDTDAVDELYVVTAVNNGTPTVSKATGGGDEHNKGYFADLTALQTAYPTGADGDYAILGSTDTVWVWDSGTNAWVDTDTKGEVTSVNNRTGAVTVSEVPDQTGYSGRVLGTDGSVAGWVVPEQVQRSTLPQAAADEEGHIYQFTGTTDANYTNGYFYKCVSDGQDPATYSWEAVEVQASSGGNYLPLTGGTLTGIITQDIGTSGWADFIAVKNTTYPNNPTVLQVQSNSTSTLNFRVKGGNLSLSNVYTIGASEVAGSIGLPTAPFSFICIETIYARGSNYNYPITIPQNTTGTIVVATPPTSDGTYVLKATVSSGVVTYTWVAE